MAGRSDLLDREKPVLLMLPRPHGDGQRAVCGLRPGGPPVNAWWSEAVLRTMHLTRMSDFI